jgi:hypothetical protein
MVFVSMVLATLKIVPSCLRVALGLQDRGLPLAFGSQDHGLLLTLGDGDSGARSARAASGVSCSRSRENYRERALLARKAHLACDQSDELERGVDIAQAGGSVAVIELDELRSDARPS